MNNKFIISTQTFASQCDKNQTLRHDAILSIFQDLATAHSIEMKVDHNTLKERSNAFWVITKLKFKTVGKICHNEPVTLETWPLKPDLIRYLRDFHISAKNGEIHGSSEWCMLDYKNQTIRRLNTVCYPVDLIHEQKRADVTPFLRLNEQTDESNLSYRYKAVLSDIDMNGHVNNVSYAKMALNAFSLDEFYSLSYNAFEIHFISQCYFGDEICIYKKTVGDNIFIDGKVNGKQVFKCLFYNE